MWRYWVGAAATLVLIVGGIFWWRSTAIAKHRLPDAPTATVSIDGGEEQMPAPPAASDKTREEKRFSRSDHDKNGVISSDEFLAARRRNFAKLDANGDGKLSFEEYAVKAEEHFAKADADKSGSLNPAEFATTRAVRKTKASCACQPARNDDKGDEKSDDGA